jgi:hypothetical protein
MITNRLSKNCHFPWHSQRKMKLVDKAVYCALLFFMMGTTQVYSQTTPVPDQSAVIDQQNNPILIYGTSPKRFYQTFTAGLTGNLEKIGVGLTNQYESVRIRVFHGSGISGNLLGTKYLNIFPVNGVLSEFNLTGISVTQGQQYTFELSSNTYFNCDFGNNDSYTGGKLFASYNGVSFDEYISNDLIFKTYVSNANQTFCEGATVANLTAFGTNVKWYSTANGGNQLSTSDILVTGQYYVSQTIDNIESDRNVVNVSILLTTSTEEITTDCSYTWLANGETYTSSGTYSALIGGCATKILNLTISSKSIAGTVSGGASVPSGTNSITLTLNGYSGTSIQWQSATSTDGPYTDIIGATNSTYTLTDLTAATYTSTNYRAKVINGNCNADYSLPAAVTVVGDISGLTPPGAINVNYGFNNDIALNITTLYFPAPTQDAVNNPITNYEYSFDNGVTWTPRLPASTNISVEIPGLDFCTPYNIIVRAVTPVTVGPASIFSWNFDVQKSTITSINPRDNSLKVNISNNFHYINNYEYSTDGGTTWTLRSPASNASPLIITGLTNGTSYAVTVKPVLDSNWMESCPSTVMPATPNLVNTANLTPPGAITLTGTYRDVSTDTGMVFFSTPTQDSVNNPITNYEYSLDNGLIWIAKSPASTNPDIFITDLNDCTNYNVIVRAVTDFSTGPASNVRSLNAIQSTITSLFPRPNAVKVNISNTSVPYQISNYEYSIDGGATWTPRSPASTSLSLTITGLTNGTTYAIAVKPVLMNAGTAVPCSSVVMSATPAEGIVAAAPTIVSAVSNNAGGSISFTLPSDGGADITNYPYSLDNGTTWITPSPAFVSSPLNITGLTNCSTYQVIIRAVNSVGSGASSTPVTIAPLNVAVLGTNWTARTAASALNWASVTYGNGLFVAVARSSGSSNVMTSPDGITWTLRMPSSIAMNWNCVTYGNGLFVAVGTLIGASTDKTVMTSPDGITWTERTAISNNLWNSVVYGNGLFVAVALGGNSVMISPDGITWTAKTFTGGVTTSFSSITYGNGKFVAVSNMMTSNKVMYSDDGINWTSVNGIDGKPWNRITYGNGNFVASASGGALQNIMTSPDGINWVLRDHPEGGLPCIAFGNGLFVAMGNGTNKIITSEYGKTWIAKTAPSGGYQSVVFGNGQFVAVSANSGGNFRVTTSETAAVADAPVITSATIGSAATIAFTQAVSSIASAITNYEYSTDNGTIWVAVSPSATASPLTINGVPSGAQQIMLRAVNSVGVSCASNNFISNGGCTPSTTTETVTACTSYTWAENGETYATSGTYSSVTDCITKNLVLIISGQPAPPTGLTCYEVATWNAAICDYEINIVSPVAPTVNCYQSTAWDEATCSWIISGTQPDAPIHSCAETATWNATTCQYDIVTTIQAPSIACYEAAVWNSENCQYDITGTKPDQPALTCYETVVWNAATCEWDITGVFPAAPPVNCYETANWNEATCDYDVAGTMPETPEVNCYETATWNATSCQYDITGAFPAEPTVLCYQTATWNSASCTYDITGEKPSAPIVACYETATWNSNTCEYDITGAQAAEPALLCYQTATWNSANCSYDITGTKPSAPIVACYETATWNSDSCEYDITGAQPAAPTLLCYQTADFNTTSCKWVVSGSQPRITSISGAGAICNGASKTLALATGTVGTLQWQSSTTSATASDFTNSSDTTDLASLTVTPVVSTWYRALASVGTCPPATSAAVAVLVGQPTAVGTISALSSSICTSTGTTLTLSDATGTIAWQKATVINGVTGAFTTVSGNATTTLVTGNLSTTTAYRVVVSSGVCSTSISEPITITVSRSSVARTISGAGVICNGASKTLSLASGSVGTTQWQSSTTSATASDFTNSSDTTNLASLTVTPAVTTWYRVVATSGACSPATSAAVAVTVSQPTAVGTLSALSSSICTGTGTTLTLSDATGTIAWQKATVINGVTGAFTTVSGNATTTLVTANLTTSAAYRVIVSSGACSTSISEPITITVSRSAVAKTISGAGVICNGASKTLTLAAGSVGTTQWQSSTTSATASDFTNSSDATNLASLTVTPAVTTWYRVVATSGNCSPATSAAVAVTFYQTAAVGTISALSSSICTGTGTTLTLSSAAGTIAWQRAIITNGVIGVFKTVTGNTSTLATDNLSVSVAYRAIVSSGACTTATSEPITIAVIPAAKLATITGYNTVTTPVCIGSTKTLTLAAGYVGTIEWLIANYPTGTYTVIPGATGTTYNYVPTSTAVKYFKVRLTSSPCSATITSTTIVAVYAKDCATTSAKIATVVQAASASSAVVDTNLHSDNLSSSVTPSKQTNIEVSAATTAQIEEAAIDTSLEFKVVAYPNPYNANFNLRLTSSNTATIAVAVYDMTGRQIENRTVNSSEINNIALGDNYPSGVYNVLVTQGAEIKTLRLIKK